MPTDPRLHTANETAYLGGVTGRSFIVTGAAGGIGRALTAAISAQGGYVLAVDLPGQEVRANGFVTPYAFDLRHVGRSLTPAGTPSRDGGARLITEAARLAPLAGLVHTAAVIRRSDVDEVSEADFDDQIAVNMKATFFLNRAVWRGLREASTPGSIVNYVSQSWQTGGLHGSVVYAATKGAVTTMTRGLARRFAADGVRVNAVSPGFVDTEMMASVPDDVRASLVADIPIGRIATPDDLVGATLYLLGDNSVYVTGTVLNVSGGHLMY